MSKITLDQFVSHWVIGSSPRNIGFKFEHNVHDFTTIIGHYSKQFFATSFLAGGFYGSGSRWAPRQSRWGKKFTHPVMNDTGKLSRSFSEKSEIIDITGQRNNRTKIYKKGAKYDIDTNEVSRPEAKKRGKSSKYNPTKSYAAIHNTDPRFTNYKVNQYSSKKPTQRQFIGFSPKLDADITRFIPILFRGFPNA